MLAADAANIWKQADRPDGYGPSGPYEKIFQRQWEFERLLDLYRSRTFLKVLEIGSFHGGSLYHLLQNAISGATIVSVDLPPHGTRQNFSQWAENDVMFVPFRSDSRASDTIEAVNAYGPYDFVFIDGGHYYDEVKLDWIHYGQPVRNGIVAFHDIVKGHGHPEIEVWQLWRELQAQGYVTQEYVCDPDQDWGGIGVVFR